MAAIPQRLNVTSVSPQTPAETRKAVVLDLDGTLLTGRKEVTPRTLEAVRVCLAENHLVVIATARPLRTIVHLLPSDLLECYVVLCNGARIVLKGECVHRNELPGGEVGRVVDAVTACGLSPAIEADDHLYMDPEPDHVPFCDYSSLASYQGIPACKVLGFSRRPVSASLISDALPAGLNCVVTDGGTLAQIARTGCSKATACRIVFEAERIDPARTYAFGDDTNDLSLFGAVRYGIAMANAVPELKAVAYAVTESNDADGVARGIEEYVLQ
ncbi:MAG: HAD family hydrolase, partial [Spirochaetota bacterium]